MNCRGLYGQTESEYRMENTRRLIVRDSKLDLDNWKPWQVAVLAETVRRMA